MQIKMKIIFLGTGTSHGIPMIGCNCPVCTSNDNRDKRTRCSIYIETEANHIIIDTAPEFRLQCLANDIKQIDAILFTHTHADHIVGLDDIRRFCAIQNSWITCYSYAGAIKSLKTMFSYAFADTGQDYSERPKLKAQIIDSPFEINELRIIPLELYHGNEIIFGYRIADFAYCTDCSDIPEHTLSKLQDLDVLVLDALRHTPHPTHFNLEQALEMAKIIKAKRTYLTHIAHEIKHAELETELPESIFLAYDGLTLHI